MSNNKKMKRASWIITTKCNFNCFHCYLSCRRGHGKSVSLKKGQIIIKKLKQLGIELVFISGGEPILHTHFFELMEECRKNNITICLCSNGSLLTKSMVKKLKNAGIVHISIGIESPHKDTYKKFRGKNFERVVEGIKNCVKGELNVSLDTIVTNLNKKELWDLVDFAEKLGTSGIVLKRFIPLGRGGKHKKRLSVKSSEYKRIMKKWLEESIKKSNNSFSLVAHEPIFSVLVNKKFKKIPRIYHSFATGCRAGIVSIGIYLDNFSYCPIMSKYFSVGNLANMELEEIKKILKDNPIRKRTQYNHKCRSCNYFSFCKGCRTCALATTGDFLEEDKMCLK